MTRGMSGRNFDYKKAIPVFAAAVFMLAAAVVVALSGVPQPASRDELVLFRLDAPEARSVAVVGDWNHWDPAAQPLELRDGLWQISSPLRKGSVYFYNFLIDGSKWITDPSQVAVSEDIFGRKSVLDLSEGGTR